MENVGLLNIGIFENGWGPISKEQIKTLSIFYCGICSNKIINANIYHNALGKHKHFNIIEKDFLKEVKDKVNELINESMKEIL